MAHAQAKAVPVTTSPTPIDFDLPENDPGAGISVFNNDAAKILWVGGSDVSVAEGYPIMPKTGLPFDVSRFDRLYAISPSGTIDARVIGVSL